MGDGKDMAMLAPAGEKGRSGPKELVIGRGCSSFGLHRLEVIRPQMAVEREKWVRFVEEEAARRGVGVDWKAIFPYEESETGFWRLRLYWKEVAIHE